MTTTTIEKPARLPIACGDCNLYFYSGVEAAEHFRRFAKCRPFVIYATEGYSCRLCMDPADDSGLCAVCRMGQDGPR